MDFPKKELLEKYLRIRKEIIDPYKPSYTVPGATVRYVKFNDATEDLNMFSKCLIARLLNRKYLFPKKTSAKIASNADPANYVTLQYDDAGVLRVAQCGEYDDGAYASVYVSDQLTIGYNLHGISSGSPSYRFTDFEWYEYDEAGRLKSAERFRQHGSPERGVIINCEYYDYEGDTLSHARQFKEYDTESAFGINSMVLQFVPDRIFCLDQIEFTFRPAGDGLDYTRNHYYRKSQTITHEGHVPAKTLENLKDNGIRLI